MINTLSKSMLLSRSVAAADNCKLFIPFNEGSGNILNDVSGDVVVTDNATATWAVEHTAAVNVSGLITSGTLPTIREGKKLILMDMVKVNALSSFQAIDIGTIRSLSMLGNVSISSINGGTLSAAMQSLTVGAVCIRLMTWDTVTGVISSFSKVGSLAAQYDNTSSTTNTDYLGEVKLVSKMIIGNNATFIGDYYGIALFEIGALPSNADIIAEMDITYNNWIKGIKMLPETFVNI